MTEQQREPTPDGKNEHGDGTTFKREGPAPAERDSGDSVEEMNRIAEESKRRNVRPEDDLALLQRRA